MAKERIHITVEEELLTRFKAIAERQRWSYATAIEIAIELFIGKFAQLELPGLTPETTPEVEKAR
jgi:metal-responsive CopG/Arc/MetJ family transcriptional regulator